MDLSNRGWYWYADGHNSLTMEGQGAWGEAWEAKAAAQRWLKSCGTA